MKLKLRSVFKKILLGLFFYYLSNILLYYSIGRSLLIQGLDKLFNENDASANFEENGITYDSLKSTVLVDEKLFNPFFNIPYSFGSLYYLIPSTAISILLVYLITQKIQLPIKKTTIPAVSPLETDVPAAAAISENEATPQHTVIEKVPVNPDARNSKYNNRNKIISREFIYIMAVVILSFISSYFINKINDKNYDINQINTARLDSLKASLSHRQNLWQLLNERGFEMGSYDHFLNNYKDNDAQKSLYNLVTKNQLYTLTFEDFKNRYFYRDLIIDEMYLSNREALPKILNDKNELLAKYHNYVNRGHTLSLEGYTKLLSDSTESEILGKDLEKNINTIKALEKKDQEGYHHLMVLEIVTIPLLVVLFLFRYLIYALRWRFKKVKV